MLNFVAYRAVDHPDACERFIVGHARILESIGVTKVTSAKTEWTQNPDVYVALVEKEGRTVGGARLQIANKLQPLPVDEAIRDMDPAIVPYIAERMEQGCGEVGGLWHSREVSGLGIGGIFLTRALVAVAMAKGVRTLIGLCAPYTIQVAANLGYVLEPRLGTQGTFYYPKEDLLATVMVHHDLSDLSHAIPLERDRLLSLSQSPNQVYVEQGRKGEVEIDYRLEVR